MSTRKFRSYNVRIIENSKTGEFQLGFVSYCYKTKDGFTWKHVPKSVRQKMSKKIGIATIKLEN